MCDEHIAQNIFMNMRNVCIMMLCLGIHTISKAQVSVDSFKNIELPAAMIKDRVAKDEQATRKIDKQTLERLNQGQDLPFLLNSLSSVVVNSDAGAGTGYTGIRIRGTDLSRINVTMNGVPVNDPESQFTFFVNTPDLLSSAQDLQISKGVGSSKNGNASFGGAITINTMDVQQSEPSFSYMMDAGSFRTLKNTLKASTGLLNDKFIATIRLSSIQSDGYIERSASDLKAAQVTAKYLLSPSTQLSFNYLRGRERTGQAWNGVPQDSLTTNRRYNELGMRNDGTFYDNQTDNYGQDYYQFFVDHSIDKHFSVGSTLFYTRGKGYYEEYRTDQRFSRYGRPDFVAGTDTIRRVDLIRQLWLDNHFYGGRLYLNYVSKKVDAGIYFNYNQYDAKHYGDVIWAQYGFPDKYRWYNLDAFKNDFNVYSMADFKLTDQVRWLVDLQYRHVNYTLNGFRNNPDIRHDLQFNFFNPKSKLSIKGDKHQANWILGIAQKEPNRDDIEASVNNLPVPEKLYNTELNYVYSPNKHWRFFSTLFLMYYQDQLVLTGKINDVGAYTRSNIPESYRVGLELESQWKQPQGKAELALNLALSRNKVLNFVEYIDDYDNGGQLQVNYRESDISFSPSVVAGGRISIFPWRANRMSRVQLLSFDILPKYVSRQYLDNTSNKSRSIAPYTFTDVVAQYPIAMGSKATLTLRAGAYNVFNALYSSNGYTFSYLYEGTLTTQNYFFPQAGLRWMLGAGISW